jgi:photosystem II stability/assembly factor-like uncharacterized protein
MFRRLTITIMLLALVGAVRADELSAVVGKRRASKVTNRRPCSVVNGVPAVTFTLDEGATTTPLAQPLTGIGYTFGLVALDVPNTLLAFHNEALLMTTDAGCTWTTLKTFGEGLFPPDMIAAPGGRAYAWSPNRDFLMRHTPSDDTVLKSPDLAITGAGADPHDGAHLRIGGHEGLIWDSADAGATWKFVGGLRYPEGGPSIYKFVFDPANIDHVVAGTSVKGAFVSFDGGRNWTPATGLSKGNANVFNLVISPADPNVVWAMGIDLAESNPDANGRHIYRSTDGGLNYATVIDAAPDVHLVNGPTMAAHPRNPDILYFVFGTYFQGYGTDLFRYNAVTRMLSVTHSEWNKIDAIAFDPDDPALMYLGLEVLQGVL